MSIAGSTTATDTGVILFMMNSWASSAGGIQTVNRELCKALARKLDASADNPIVACLVVDPDPDEILDAKNAGVDLLSAEKVSRSEVDDRILISMRNESLAERNVLIIVGHSKFTGNAAIHLREHQFPDAYVAFFFHMDPEETERFKSDWLDPDDGKRLAAERDQRRQIECELATQADMVFGVGPRLARRIEDAMQAFVEPGVRPPPVYQLLCGMHDHDPSHPGPSEPSIWALGRTDHVRVKGLDLFARAAGKIIKTWHEAEILKDRPEPTFFVRGGGDDIFELQSALENLARDQAERSVRFTVKPYTIERQSLEEDLRRASVFVMPSRAEGYGLVAMEAISWRVPIIVSKNSGVGEMLNEELPIFINKRLLLFDIRGDDDQDAETLMQMLLSLLAQRNESLEWAEFLRKRLLSICSWSQAANIFIDKIQPDPLDKSSRIDMAIAGLIRKAPASIQRSGPPAPLGRVASVYAVNGRGENWVSRTNNGLQYRDHGIFRTRLHFQIEALQSGKIGAIWFLYEDGKYQVLSSELELNGKTVRLRKDGRLSRKIELNQGDVLDVRIMSQLAAKKLGLHYDAADYGSIEIEIELNDTTHVVLGAINPAGQLLIGRTIKDWIGSKPL